jgi:hypothetical protein
VGRVVRVTDPEEAVRLFEAGMLYWHHADNRMLRLGGLWNAQEIATEVRCYQRHRLSYIVEEDSEE